MKRFTESLLSSLMLVLMLMVGGSAKAEATLGSKLTSLDQLSNGKFYAIHNTNNEGFWCYNQTVNQDYLSIVGVTTDGNGVVSNAAANEAYHAAYNAADVNGQWQIIQFNGVYYVYNVGAQKYLTRSGRDYQLTETATAIDGIKVVEEGVFAFHAGGGMSDGSTNYACIVTNTTPQAVRNWTATDHGSKMWISEIEGLEEDLTVANTLEEVAKQAARTTAFNELLGNVRAAYNGNFSYTEGADIITDASWFSSPHTCPQAKEPKSDITKLIDGDCKTYWHTDWTNDVDPHTHYLQVNLPEAIEGLTQMVMGRRDNNGSFCDNDNPIRMSATFSADDSEYSTPTYFDTPFNQTVEEPYVKAVFNVPAGTKYLRFYSEQNNGSLQRGYWHCGEFQLKPVTIEAECANATHPNATAAMLAAIEAAEGVDAATVTEAQLEALQTAYDTYVAALEQPEAPIAQPINLEQVYLQSKTGQYFGIAGGQVTVSEEPYAMTFTAIEGQENAYSFRNYDNTHWINSGSSGWLSTAPISQTNNIRNYYFYEATITETGVTGTLVEQPVKGKEYMVVVKNINSGNHAGLYALYCGTASSNSERFDVVKITSDNSVIPAEFTLNSENRHDVDIKNSTPGSALEDFQKVVWNIVEPTVPSSYEYTVAISGAPEEAEVYVTVEGDETHYTNGQTVTTTTELTAEQVSAAEVEGYVAEVTVENNTITVVYSAEDILSFEFADNGDGTYTITPSNNEDTYFACVTSDAINTEYEVESDAGMFEYNTIFITEPETETCKGATTINPVEWINWWFAGYFSPEPGEYRLLAAKIKYVQEYDEEDGKTYEWYEPDGDIASYTFTIQDTEGLGTVLSAEAGKHIFNLKGVRQNTLQRGINIVAGKKVLK